MSHHHNHASVKNIRTAFFLNLIFTIVELIGGVLVNSVAIISDAIHDLGDTISLGTSWYLQKKSTKPATKRFSFGYRRFSLFGALINSIVLIIGSIYVVSEAIERLYDPQTSDAVGMMYFAIAGVLVNSYAAWKLSSGKSLNERVVSWHLIEDVLGWVAVFIVSIILQFKEINYLDPALSLLITMYILYNVIKRLRETLILFLQGVPDDVSLEDIEQQLLRIPDLDSVHHMHIWSLDGEQHVFSCHVIVDPNCDMDRLKVMKEQIKRILKPYPFANTTVETELPGEACESKG